MTYRYDKAGTAAGDRDEARFGVMAYRNRVFTGAGLALRGSALALALAVAGCAGIPGTENAQVGGAPSGGSSNPFAGIFGTTQPTPQPDPSTTRITGLDCPPIDVRQGAGSYTLYANPRDQSLSGVRYQFSIGQLARECSILGETMTIKVGVQGRAVVGPAGGAGNADAPIRIALTTTGTEPRTIWTRFYRIPVTVAAGQSSVSFVHVEEDLTIPLPPKSEFDSYQLYVGYDPQGLTAQPARPQRNQPQRPRS
jgi:hypothetical protein